MIAERFSGNRKIIESDSVYLYSKDDELVLCFMFKEKNFDVKVRQSHIESRDIHIMNLIVDGTCFFMEPLERCPGVGIGTSAPVEIASMGEKKLYIHIWCFPVSENVTKVEYTVFSSDS